MRSKPVTGSRSNPPRGNRTKESRLSRARTPDTIGETRKRCNYARWSFFSIANSEHRDFESLWRRTFFGHQEENNDSNIFCNIFIKGIICILAQKSNERFYILDRKKTNCVTLSDKKSSTWNSLTRADSCDSSRIMQKTTCHLPAICV